MIFRVIYGQFTTIRVKIKNMNFREFPVNFHEFCFLRFLEQAFGFLENMRTSIEENGRSIGAFQPLF